MSPLNFLFFFFSFRPNPFSAPCNRCRYLEFHFSFTFNFLFKYERTRTFVLCENMAPLLQARCSVGKCNIPLILFLSLQQASYDFVPLVSFATFFSPLHCTRNVRKQFNNIGILIYCLSLVCLEYPLMYTDRAIGLTDVVVLLQTQLAQNRTVLRSF